MHQNEEEIDHLLSVHRLEGQQHKHRQKSRLEVLCCEIKNLHCVHCIFSRMQIEKTLAALLLIAMSSALVDAFTMPLLNPSAQKIHANIAYQYILRPSRGQHKVYMRKHESDSAHSGVEEGAEWLSEGRIWKSGRRAMLMDALKLGACGCGACFAPNSAEALAKLKVPPQEVCHLNVFLWHNILDVSPYDRFDFLRF